MGQTVSPREMIETLIGFDTTSRDSNLALIHHVRDYLAGWGVESTLIHNEDGNKANLYATVGPAVDGGVVLSGHTDVVPIDGQDWDSDPWTVTEKGGRLYGRGTCDMKSFSAIGLAHVPKFLEAGLKVPIHFALSYDEEVGCLGVHSMIDHIGTLAVRPKAVIVGEPTDMKVVNAHKGCVTINTKVRGLEAHSSAIQLGVNSIYHAAELVGFIQALAEEMAEGPDRNERFNPPYTTVHIGTIRGGTARNIIPKETEILWEFRPLPEFDHEHIVTRFREFAETEVLPKMRARHPEAEIVTEVTNRLIPLVPADDSPAETLAMALVGSNETGAVSYGTEAGAFQRAEIPTVVCGPGNIEQAHKPNEFIELSQIDACIDFMDKLAGSLSR